MAANQSNPSKTKSLAGLAFKAILFLAIGLTLISLIPCWDLPDLQPAEGLLPEDPARPSLRKEAERVADAFIEKNSAASFYTFRPCSLAVEKAAMAVGARVAAVAAGRAALATARCATSVFSFGISIAAGVALDWMLTEAAKVEVRRDLLESLHSWRKETIAGFRNEAEQAMRRGWELRAQELREAVTLEALAYLKTPSNS